MRVFLAEGYPAPKNRYKVLTNKCLINVGHHNYHYLFFSPPSYTYTHILTPITIKTTTQTLVSILLSCITCFNDTSIIFFPLPLLLCISSSHNSHLDCWTSLGRFLKCIFCCQPLSIKFTDPGLWLCFKSTFFISLIDSLHYHDFSPSALTLNVGVHQGCLITPFSFLATFSLGNLFLFCGFAYNFMWIIPKLSVCILFKKSKSVILSLTFSLEP